MYRRRDGRGGDLPTAARRRSRPRCPCRPAASTAAHASTSDERDVDGRHDRRDPPGVAARGCAATSSGATSPRAWVDHERRPSAGSPGAPPRPAAATAGRRLTWGGHSKAPAPRSCSPAARASTIRRATSAGSLPVGRRGAVAGERASGQPGLGVRRADVVHVDAAAAQLGPERRGDGTERGLAGGVRRHPRHRPLGHHGADLQQEALRLLQQRQHPTQEEERTDHVGQEELLDDLVRGVGQRAEGHHSGGVDQAVEATEVLACRSGDRVTRRASPRSATTGTPVPERRQPVGVAADHEQPGAASRRARQRSASRGRHWRRRRRCARRTARGRCRSVGGAQGGLLRRG